MVTKAKTVAAEEARQPGKKPDTSTWLTRVEAADMLSLSIQTLANYEEKGKLHPQYVYRNNRRGQARLVRVYDPHELKDLPRVKRFAIAPREPGAIAAHAYDLFCEGKSENEVVQEMFVTPDVARELHERWKDGGGADLVITTAAKEVLEKIVGPFKSVADLVGLVTRLKEPQPQPG